MKSDLQFFFFFFYHLPFVTLSTYFIAFHILTRDFTSYMQSFINFIFLILENDLSELSFSLEKIKSVEQND